MSEQVVQSSKIVSQQYRTFASDRRKPRNPQKEMLNKVLKLSPHFILGGFFIFTANSHLLIIPFITGGLQWMYMNRHIQKMTLYYDLYQLSNNPNVVAAYGKVREVLLTDPQFALYINQPQGQDSKDLIIENPVFQPFSYKTDGIIGRIDEKRRRYSFDCAFRDISKDSEGKVQSLIVFNDQNEAYFESFSVFLTRPVEKTVRIQETEIEDPDISIAKFNRPRRPVDQTQRPEERPKSKFRQY